MAELWASTGTIWQDILFTNDKGRLAPLTCHKYIKHMFLAEALVYLFVNTQRCALSAVYAVQVHYKSVMMMMMMMMILENSAVTDSVFHSPSITVRSTVISNEALAC